MVLIVVLPLGGGTSQPASTASPRNAESLEAAVQHAYAVEDGAPLTADRDHRMDIVIVPAGKLPDAYVVAKKHEGLLS